MKAKAAMMIVANHFLVVDQFLGSSGSSGPSQVKTSIDSVAVTIETFSFVSDASDPSLSCLVDGDKSSSILVETVTEFEKSVVDGTLITMLSSSSGYMRESTIVV